MSKFRDEDEFNIDEDQRYAFGEDYDLDDEDSGLDDDEDYGDYDLDDDYIAVSYTHLTLPTKA